MEAKLQGVFAPISTPFFENGDVNYEGLAFNVKRYAAAGLDGYLALGSNGENKSLTNDEKLKVLKTIIDNKGEGQVVMAGCIFESTFETIMMAKEITVPRKENTTPMPRARWAWPELAMGWPS